MSLDRKVGRRHFFREALRELLNRTASAMEPVQEALRHLELVPEEGSKPTIKSRNERHWLRPPGALFPDQGFRDTCSGCRACVEICPAQCIKIDSSGESGEGAPFIDANVMACVV